MPEKQWLVWLNDVCRVEAEKHTKGGRVTGFRVVLFVDIDGELHCVTRFDTAHGFAQTDILAFGGRLIGKKIMNEQDFTLAFEGAYFDIPENHEHYLRTYKKGR